MYKTNKKTFLSLAGTILISMLFSASVLAQPSFIVESTNGPIGDVAQVRWHFQDADPASICGIDVCIFVPDNDITNINLDDCFEDVGAPHAASAFSQCAVRVDGSCFTDPDVPAVPADTSVIRIALIDFGSTILNPNIAEDAAGFLNLTLSGALNDTDTINIEAYQVANAFAECDGTPITPDVVSGGVITALDAAAVLNVQPDELNFGGVPTGATSAPQPVTVSNDGTDGIDLLVTSFTITGDFALEGGGSCAATTPFTLADGASCTQHIEFNPQADGVVAGTFSVASDAGDVTNDTVNLSGEGLASTAALTIDPAAWDFEDQDIDDGPVCTNFTLANTPGDDDLTIGTVTVAAPFTVTGNCNDETLGGGASCVVEACFDPAAEGAFAETLNATSDAGDVSAALTGTGTAEADVAFNPPFGPVSLGDGSAGDILSANGSVTNSGSAGAEVACTLDDATGVFSTDPSPLTGPLAAGATIDFTLFCALPADAEDGDTYEANLSCSVDGEPAGTHNLSCAVSTFQAIPVPTMQNWALVLFALMMLLIGGISIRFFRAS